MRVETSAAAGPDVAKFVLNLETGFDVSSGPAPYLQLTFYENLSVERRLDGLLLGLASLMAIACHFLAL